MKILLFIILSILGVMVVVAGLAVYFIGKAVHEKQLEESE